MATYILLGVLTDEGADRLRTHPDWIDEINNSLEAQSIHVLSQFAVLGPYDIVTIIEAPDNKSVVRVSAQLTMRGAIKLTTLPALPIDEFVASLV